MGVAEETVNVEAKESGEVLCEDEFGELIVVSCYSRFDNLAHGPKGTEAKNPLYVFRLQDGALTLLNITGAAIENPAFSRFIPSRNVLYTCSEDVGKNGKIYTFRVGPRGEMQLLGEEDAGGKSTCFLTVDKKTKNMLVANYWDSTLSVLPMDQTGVLSPAKAMYDPNQGKELTAKAHSHANHSNNDASTIAERQGDPHSHAIVLDPFVGCIAYVPDLGMDVIREFYYNEQTGDLHPLCTIQPGDPEKESIPHGPRYIEFHPTIPVAYVINEISSTVAVYSVDVDLIKSISSNEGKTEETVHDLVACGKHKQTLKLIQLIRCIPEAFPAELNTSGRICAHASGDYVLVSNRGHESIAIFRVQRNVDCIGKLVALDFYHTRGNTPRHFAFDSTGSWLIAANQDSDRIAIFKFDQLTGKIQYTGNDYVVPSPNFVCSCPINTTQRAHPVLNPLIQNLKKKTHEKAIYADVAKLKICLDDALNEIANLREEIRVTREQKREE